MAHGGNRSRGFKYREYRRNVGGMNTQKYVPALRPSPSVPVRAEYLAELSAQTPTLRAIVLVDVPNLHGIITEMIERIPESAELPNYYCLHRWVLDDMARRWPGWRVEVEMNLFINKREHQSRKYFQQLHDRNGWNVVVKDKLEADDDIDGDIVTHVEQCLATQSGNIFYFVGNDLANFMPLIRNASMCGIDSMLIYFPGMVQPTTSSRMQQNENLERYDIQAIDGFIRV